MTSSETMVTTRPPAIWSRPTVGWMLYDLANTMFSFAILTFYFPRWIVNELGGNDAQLGYAVAASMGLMLVSAPVLGALSDQSPRRMPFLVVTTVLCVLFTTLLGVGGLWLSLIFFGVANFFFQAGLIFYDALLPVVSSEENRGRVSGFGVGLGYVGSFIMLGVGSLVTGAGGARETIFRLTALLFLLFALPCFLFVREPPRRHGLATGRAMVREALRDVWRTASRIRAYPQLSRFLLGRIFYTDVANTLIAFMAIYVEQELRFTETMVTSIATITIVSSIAGGFLWGLVLDRIGPKRTLVIILGVWMVDIVLGVLIPVLNWPRGLFFPVAVIAGLTLGGTWAADRLLMLRLSPPRYLGQFYGIYAMVGRFGQIIGPLLWGFVAIQLGLGRPAALLSLSALTVLALVILRPVQDERRRWRSDELA